jgi:integrase
MARRRGNNEGSIGKVAGRNLYAARYTVQTPDGPKRKKLYRRTRREAADALAEALGDVAKGLIYDDENMTTAEFMTRWLRDAHAATVRESTYSRDEYLVNNHIIPTTGRIKLRNLNALHLAGLYRERMDSGLSGSTVQKVHHVLH